MQLPNSYKIAISIFVLVLLYFAGSTLIRVLTSSNTETEQSTAIFSVRAANIAPSLWQDTIRVRGRTKAIRTVTVRAETPGSVLETPAQRGQLVEENDVLCRLKIDARQAAVSEAKAAVSKATLDYTAAEKLAKGGFRSETAVATAKAALDLSRARLEQATLNVEKTNIVAPFKGIFDQRMVEVGDYMGVGAACGVVIQQSPFLVVGSVAEKDIAKISIGDQGRATLATGEQFDGVVRFIAAAADAATRTFKVELEITTENAAFRDGVTAQFKVSAKQREAHLVPRNALILHDDGRIGVRTVVSDNIVEFNSVFPIGENIDGMWVDGLNGSVSIITSGQNYVSAGEKVKVDYSAGASTP